MGYLIFVDAGQKSPGINMKKDKIEEKIYEELGYVSSLFMSQGDTRAGDIVMPSEELVKSGEKIVALFDKALASQKAKWEKQLKGLKHSEGCDDWGTGICDSENAVLDDAIRLLKKL